MNKNKTIKMNEKYNIIIDNQNNNFLMIEKY